MRVPALLKFSYLPQSPPPLLLRSEQEQEFDQERESLKNQVQVLQNETSRLKKVIQMKEKQLQDELDTADGRINALKKERESLAQSTK